MSGGTFLIIYAMLCHASADSGNVDGCKRRDGEEGHNEIKQRGPMSRDVDTNREFNPSSPPCFLMTRRGQRFQHCASHRPFGKDQAMLVGSH